MELTDVKIEELAPCVLRMHSQAPSLSKLYFGLPVYLVGGALTDPDPRDIDVVVVIPDNLFVLTYGDRECFQKDGHILAISQWTGDNHDPNPEKLWRRWALDCAKHNRKLTANCHRRVDFRTQPQSHAEAVYADKPRAVLFQGFNQ